ncbi:glycine/betaine ABC transporter [Salipaludibacillus keqinensis]|uniref:Glycine/betaine ABC transporter n=2 Tax=Salipaludibacillus keqinensis TaxID=2045207 RepID=A0A323TRY4_9BACI|nr:BCCT family transporter [Salipaludibacillus keqinensis]PYZ92145.1 glycine/betaine ABC transporter [Salipaludibacillus keqinensis]
MRKYEYETKKPNIVFYISAPLVALFVLWGGIGPDTLASVSESALGFTLNTFGWFYMLSTAFFIAFVLFLAISPFGKLRLGKADEKPEYKFFTWLGMLFSAGIGVGFVFWGVAEPVLYFFDPHPDFVDASEGVRAAAGLRYGVFHWALHPWAIFSLVALTLAYVQFRKDQPALISSAFQPILGDKARGPFGKGIDTLAVLATSTGVATTFGLSAMQITGGLSYLVEWIPNTAATQLTIIAIVTVLFIFSAATGVNKGIKILSTINLTIAAILLVFVIVMGPTLFIAQNFVTTIGDYIANVTRMSLDLNPFGDGEWLGNNTIFFWAWHISWAPFMGIFIARISRGRTIREFVAGVLIVPSVLAALWFTAFGGTALDMILGGNEQIGDLVMDEVEVALFATLGNLPLSMIMSVLAVILIVIFFITSADSASYVLGAMTSSGSLNPKLSIKVIWGFLIAGTAAVLLLSGGLEGLQTASIVAALPFAIIMVVMIFSLLIMMGKDLKADKLRTTKRERRKVKDEVYGGMKENIYEDFKDEAYEEIKEDVYEQMKDEVYEDFKGEAQDHIKDEVYEQVKDEVYDDFKEEAYKDIKSEVYEQVKDEVYDDIKKEIYEEFKEKIYEDLRDDIGNQLNGDLEARDQDEKKSDTDKDK